MDYIGLKMQACVQASPIENIKDQKEWKNLNGISIIRGD